MTAPDARALLQQVRETLRWNLALWARKDEQRMLRDLEAIDALLASTPPEPDATNEEVREAAGHVQGLVAALGRSDDLTPDEFASLESARRWLASRGGAK